MAKDDHDGKIVIRRAGIGDYIYPAETPAKRVWNLATLARDRT